MELIDINSIGAIRFYPDGHAALVISRSGSQKDIESYRDFEKSGNTLKISTNGAATCYAAVIAEDNSKALSTGVVAMEAGDFFVFQKAIKGRSTFEVVIEGVEVGSIIERGLFCNICEM